MTEAVSSEMLTSLVELGAKLFFSFNSSVATVTTLSMHPTT